MMDEFKKSINSWQPGDSPYTKGMAKVYAQDRKDLMGVYDYLIAKQEKDAAKKAYYLDTVVRDQIPVKICKYLNAIEI